MTHFFRRLAHVNLSAICFALSAIALGYSLQITNGFYDLTALKWLSGALALCIAATLMQRVNASLSRWNTVAVVTILSCGIAWQIYELLTTRPGFYVSDTASMGLFKTLVVGQGVLVGLGLLRHRLVRRVWFPLVLVLGAGLGVWMIRASPEPHIDVVVVHKEAIDALLKDKDPYRISFENIYDIKDIAKYYNPEAVIGNRLAFGYPYPPASLLLAVPGQVLFGDYRYAELALLIVGVGLIGYSQRTLAAQLAACLLLTTPRIWFVIEQGWTEPIAIFALALTVFLIGRSPVAAGWAAGLFAVTKQYLGFCGLVIVRLIFIRRRQWFWIGFGIVMAACAVTLPLALWHPNAFMRNVVWLQTQEPFRMDSLSYLSWAAHNGMGQGSFLWAVGSASAAAFIGLAATRNTPAGFAASVALTTFLMFAFGSKAFCNYYFFVIGALCSALAAYPDKAASSNPPLLPEESRAAAP